MEKLQLEYFCTIAEAGSITKAAQSLNISQSSLSQTISKLERQLQVKLLERVPRGIRLTKEGRLFLTYAADALIRERNIRQQLLDSGNEPSGEIILKVNALSSTVVRLFIEFKKQYPNVEAKFLQSSPDDLNELDRPDLTITGAPIDSSHDDSALLITEKIMAALSPEHPLAKKDSISLSALAKERFIIFGSPERTSHLIHYCAISGFTPNIWMRCRNTNMIFSMVENHLGVSVVPNTWEENMHQKVVLVPIVNPPCEREVRVVWTKKQYLSKATRLFRDYIIENFSAMLERDM